MTKIYKASMQFLMVAQTISLMYCLLKKRNCFSQQWLIQV